MAHRNSWFAELGVIFHHIVTVDLPIIVDLPSYVSLPSWVTPQKWQRPFRRVSQLQVRWQHSPVALTTPGDDCSVRAATCGEGVLGGLDLRDVVEPEMIYRPANKIEYCILSGDKIEYLNNPKNTCRLWHSGTHKIEVQKFKIIKR